MFFCPEKEVAGEEGLAAVGNLAMLRLQSSLVALLGVCRRACWALQSTSWSMARHGYRPASVYTAGQHSPT